MNTLLHPDCLQRMPVGGPAIEQLLHQRTAEVAVATQDVTDPTVSVVVRTRNEHVRLEALFQDIATQKFSGEVQLIVIDSDPTDSTKGLCKDFRAQIAHINQDSFSHPKALNLGFEMADHELVLSLVAHSNLVTKVALAGITRWAQTPNLGGIYGPAALPDAYATSWERLLAAGMRLHRRLEPAGPLDELENGAMATHRAVFSKTAWRELGTFDLRYGAGGEDKAMARSMHTAGMAIIREPVLSIYHSHGTGLADTVRQALEYRRLRSGPRSFDAERLSYRRDLRLDKQ